jgi:hypothetical protein
MESREHDPARLTFPPKLLSQRDQEDIISNFCVDLAPEKIEKAGCAVCGLLTLTSELAPVAEFDLE